MQNANIPDNIRRIESADLVPAMMNEDFGTPNLEAVEHIYCHWRSPKTLGYYYRKADGAFEAQVFGTVYASPDEVRVRDWLYATLQKL